MKSAVRRALTLGSILVSTMLVAGGCVSSPAIVVAPSACSSLVPSSHRAAVESAALPPAEAVAGDWVSFGVAQTGQLGKANGHTADVLEIVSTCEARDAAALRRLKRPWWRFW